MLEHIHIWIGIISAIFGALSGVALAAWYLSARNSTLARHDKEIEDIKTQRKELLVEIKSTVCAGFKLSMAELRAEQDKRHGGHETAIAVLTERMDQTEADIASIFGRLNRRAHDRGRPEGDRRNTGG